MIRPVTSNTEVAALLDKQAAAVRWMQHHNVPLLSMEGHVELWLRLEDEAITRMEKDDDNRSDR